MVTYVQNKKARIASAITTISADLPYDVAQQKECVKQWSDTIKRVIVMGAIDPESRDGVRLIKSASRVPLAHLIGSYMFQVPGNEVVIVAAPNVFLGGNQQGLIEFVNKQRMDLAWCGKINGEFGKAFVLSSGVVPHLMKDIPQTLVFSDDWFKWIDEWMTINMQKHRYFDASEYGILIAKPEPKVAIQKPTESDKKPAKKWTKKTTL